ncbi:uncharacterized protein METZ01_LOCUS483360, partial [marine metagenome]
VYPHGVQPLFIGTEKSIRALEQAQGEGADKRILLVAKLDPANNDPLSTDLYQFGTTATILQLIRLPDKTVKILVEGESRAIVSALTEQDGIFVANVELVEEEPLGHAEGEALSQSLMAVFGRYVQLSKKVPKEVVTSLAGVDDPSRLVDTIASQLKLKLSEKQAILEMKTVRDRIDRVSKLLTAEIELTGVEKKLRGRVKKQMERSQREYYLNEQMKAIQKELGDLEEAPNEIEELQLRLK